MNFFMKIAYLSLMYFILQVNHAFSRCRNERKIVEMVGTISLEVKRSYSLVLHDCYHPLNKVLQCKTENTKCSSIRNPLLQKLWYLLRDLEEEKECIFDEVKWNEIQDNIKNLPGERVAKKDQPDVFIIPNFLTQKQCEELVKIHKEISNSISLK